MPPNRTPLELKSYLIPSKPPHKGPASLTTNSAWDPRIKVGKATTRYFQMDTLWFLSHIQSPQAFGKIRDDNFECIYVRIPKAQGEITTYPLPYQDK